MKKNAVGHICVGAGIIALSLSLMLGSRAFAGEQTTPLAASGDWIAFAHSTSLTDPPDLCLAIEPAQGFAIRADDTDIEIRLVNDKWSLPANIAGTLVADIDGHDYPLDISSNSSNMVAAIISKKTLQSMIAVMDKAASMTVTPGKGAPVVISLNGSNKVTTAFLTCAGIRAKGEGAGADPFK